MKVYEGDILTVDSADSVARYLIEDGGRIVYVGNRIPSGYLGVSIERLGERALCPSFVDTHEHLASFATFNAGLNVMSARSNVEIVDMVHEFARDSCSKMVIAFGASPHSVAESRLLCLEELDRACPDKPIFMVKYDGHACVVNSALLALVNSRVKGLRGYHPDTGEMNQEAFFAVSDFITRSISIPKLVGNIQSAFDCLASKGIGMVHTVSGVGFPGNLDIALERWVGRSAQSGFQVRVFPQSMDVGVAQKNGLPRIGGCFACALDGCFGSHDAALNEPYADVQGGDGVLYYSDDKVIDFCKTANRAGLQIELHAIGDRAFDQAARALRAALDDCPRDDHRHGIIHGCLPTHEGLSICSEYGIQMPVQTSFINWVQEPDAYLCSLLGSERASRLNPLRDYWDSGILLSAGSDAPCTFPDPIVWIDRACNHTMPSQSLSVHEALRMCTLNGAKACFDEEDRGSLETGKIADMVILNKNPYKMKPQELSRLKVERLLLSGEPYEPQNQSAASAIFRGLISKTKI